ncbi:Myb-like, SWIRM and MPN domains 1 [Branchiostoma belcheri]|nr:Myb-like, SWIRM and MPN domains 1 [Branchiostoma belcheri]
MADDEEIDIEGDDDAPLLFDHKDDALAIPDLPGYEPNWMFDQGQSWTFDEDMDEQSRSAIEKMLQEEQLYIHGRSHSSYPGEASSSRGKTQKSKTRAALHLPSHGQPWTEEEKKLFETGLEIYGRSWTSISQFVQTRTPLQVKNYARHFFKTKEKEEEPTVTEDDRNKPSFSDETKITASSSVSPGTPKRKRAQETKCATPQKSEQTPKKAKVVRKMEEVLGESDPVEPQEEKVLELSKTTAIPDKYGHMQVRAVEGCHCTICNDNEDVNKAIVCSTGGLNPAQPTVATSDDTSMEEPTLEQTDTEEHHSLSNILHQDREISKQENSEEENQYLMEEHFHPAESESDAEFPWQPDDTQNRVIVERIEGSVGLGSVRVDKDVRSIPTHEQTLYQPHPDMYQVQNPLIEFEKPAEGDQGFQKMEESKADVTETQAESQVNTGQIQTYGDDLKLMENVEGLSETVSSGGVDLKTTIQDVLDQDSTNALTDSSNAADSHYTLDIPEDKTKTDLNFVGAEKWSYEEAVSSHTDNLTYSDSESGKETGELLRCGTASQGHSEDETSDTGQAEEAFFTFKKPTEEVVLDRSVVTEEEKEVHKEFFDGRQTKTPERYLKIRNHLLDCWDRCKPDYLRKTVARAGLRNCGDVNCIGRIHGYLERIGAINFGCDWQRGREFCEIFKVLDQLKMQI